MEERRRTVEDRKLCAPGEERKPYADIARSDDGREERCFGRKKAAGKPKLRKRCMKRRAACVMAAAILMQSWPVGPASAAHLGTVSDDFCRTATSSDACEIAAGSDACEIATVSTAARMAGISLDPWEGWNGSADFPGDGTEEKPYQIRSLAHLMGLSQAVAEGESFEGEYFELTQDINLANLDVNGGNWNPIGWYQSADEMDGEVQHPFSGHFDGRGHTIRNLNIGGEDGGFRCLGLFGVIDGGSVENLKVSAGSIFGSDRTAVLAGVVRGGAVIRNVTVSGYVSAEGGQAGCAGGITAVADGTGGRVTIENCTADNIAVTSDQPDSCVGGIAGEAKAADLVDSTVQTGKINSNHIQGKGYVGGVAGRMEESRIYNSYVNGLIGGARTRAAGGIVGEYVSGDLILARFAGEISPSGMGSAAREGTFVGTRDLSHPFRYGTEPGDNLAYLFADTAPGARQAVGSGEEDDNTFPSGAHIGYWMDGQRSYRLLSGSGEKSGGETYFYQELEDGARFIITSKLQNEFTAQGATEGIDFRLDHYAPGQQGQPVRGYLLSVPRIDTRNANGTYDTDVAALTAVPEGSSYYRPIDKNNPAAVAPGVTVTVTTSPKNTETDRYQMAADSSEQGGVKPPVYINDLGRQVPMAYVTGGTYTFTMPARDTQINAEYVKVTTQLAMTPEETEITVTQTRTGDRKSPDIVTEVRDGAGTLIARYLDDARDTSVQVQPVRIHSEHNADGGTADQAVLWSVDDSDLIELVSEAGYTEEDARILPNLNSEFIRKTEEEQVKAQADGGYLEAIRPTVYEKHAVVTASSNPDTSADHVAVCGNCKVTVRFRILDYTTRRVEGLQLNKSDLVMTVTRTLTGSRLDPTETITCTEPFVLAASLYPEQPFYKNVSWSDAGSGAAILLTPQGNNASQCAVTVRFDAAGKENPAWIQNVINADNQIKKENPYARVEGSAQYTETVTAASEDQTHGHIAAQCRVTVCFKTEDLTVGTASGGYGGGSYSGSGGGASAGSGVALSGAGGGQSAVTGLWQQAADGRWSFQAEQQPYRSRWGYIFNSYADPAKGQPDTDWFYFDADGSMATGWRWIAGSDGLLRCYYFNERSDGTLGVMFHGCATPDGWLVDDSGAWILGGVVQTRQAQQ